MLSVIITTSYHIREKKEKMKTALVYFSYSGATRSLAQKTAQEKNADIYEIAFAKRPSIFGAFFLCPDAVKQKPAKNIAPFAIDWTQYTDAVIMGPIWAGFPAPPVNNIILSLPAGLSVSVYMLSAGSGTRRKDKVIGLIESRGCTVSEYNDIRGGRQNRF
jgi:hypothetical protein